MASSAGYDHVRRVAVAAPTSCAGFGEQRADRGFGLRVVALAEGRVADVAAGVDQVVGGPVLVAVGVPGAHFVVLDDGVVDAELPDRVATFAASCSKANSGVSTPTIVRPVLAVGGVPRLQVGQRADAVDAGVGPEVDQHDAPAQRGERQRCVARRVEPVLGVGEFGRGAERPAGRAAIASRLAWLASCAARVGVRGGARA